MADHVIQPMPVVRFGEKTQLPSGSYEYKWYEIDEKLFSKRDGKQLQICIKKSGGNGSFYEGNQMRLEGFRKDINQLSDPEHLKDKKIASKYSTKIRRLMKKYSDNFDLFRTNGTGCSEEQYNACEYKTLKVTH